MSQQAPPPTGRPSATPSKLDLTSALTGDGPSAKHDVDELLLHSRNRKARLAGQAQLVRDEKERRWAERQAAVVMAKQSEWNDTCPRPPGAVKRH
jgi:hypothetical protein